MTVFRPCIDLHGGSVKQIVGASLSDDSPSALRTNFVAAYPPEYYANLYRQNNLTGAHVIMLGPGNDDAARSALSAWPGGLQVGGGINISNAQSWIDAGAAKIIITSWLFPDAKFSMDRLRLMAESVGKHSLVVDLSCKRRNDQWIVAMNKWQTPTDMALNADTLATISEFTSEFLVHAADVEGLCEGIDQDLVKCLAEWSPIPCTYAGGAKDLSDISLVDRLSNGRVDLTYGSALDIFGGNGVKFTDLVAWNKTQK